MSNVTRIHPPSRSVPTATDLASLPLARSGEYELSDREVKTTRRLIYGINKDGIRRYRTMRDGTLLQVWRIK